jgi:predicted MFS family arabinose efflux permease
MSMTPSLVRRDQLEVANARITGSQIAANEFGGPPLGGLLFAVAVSIPFGVNAVTFAVSAALLLTVGGRYRPHRSEPTTVIGDIRRGFGFVWREPVIRAFAIGAGAINLGFTAAAAILVLHAQDNLGLDGFGFGLLLTAGAVGGLLGAQLAPRTIERIGRRTSVLAAVLALSAGVAGIGAAPGLLVAAIGFAAFGFAGEIWNIVSVSYRQAATPDELLGRVMSSFRVVAYGAFPIGAAVGGLIASATSLRTTIYIGAATIATLLPYLAIATAGRNLQPDHGQHEG